MTKIIEPEIKIVPWVGYNQIQAFKFGLNQNQAIIMNYFTLILPTYGNTMTVDGKTYFSCHILKPLKDMPTLDIGETTMRANIRGLIKMQLLEREVDNANRRAYYRVTEKWVNENTSYGNPPADFVTLYNNIESFIKDRGLTEAQKVKLNSLLSPYMEDEEKFNVDFDPSFKGPPVIMKIKDRLISIKEKKDNVTIRSKEVFTKEYIAELGRYIVDLGDANGWSQKDQKGNIPPDVQKKILLKLDVLFDYYKGKKIKNLKKTLYTWFNAKWI